MKGGFVYRNRIIISCSIESSDVRFCLLVIISHPQSPSSPTPKQMPNPKPNPSNFTSPLPHSPCQIQQSFLHILNLLLFSMRQLFQFKLMKKRQAQAKESPSKVLLICVYDTVIIQVTNQIVFARFSPFGPILKILIFEKGEVTKFFLEFLQLQHAVKAKNFLDGSKLYESICKMNIYYSNFASVDLKHQTTEGVNIEPLVYSPAPPYYYFPQQYYQYANYYPQDCRDQYAEVALAFQNMSLGKENYAREYFQHQNTSCEAMLGTGEQAIEKSIESSIDWLLRSEEKKPAKDEQHEQLREQEVREENCFVRFGLEQDLSNRNVYNLFSNFGNISYIKKTKHNVFIKFRSVEFAAMARNYLHGYKLMGNTLDLANLTDLTQAQPREEEYSEITYFDSSFDRFTPHKSITINPPGNTIHVSSLRRQSCRQDNLKYLFQEFGPVEAVQILGNHEKNMALVKFHNIEDSFAAVAQMHNRQIQGRKIQISFTKSKLY